MRKAFIQPNKLSIPKVSLNLKQQYPVIFAVTLCFAAFFLSKAVLFEAIVPFFLPTMAIIFINHRDYFIWTLIGGVIGSITLGFGELTIHIIELLLFSLFMKTFIRKWPIAILVGVSVFLTQIGWQMISYHGEPPMMILLYVGYESILSIFMTLFLMQLFLPMPALWTASWSLERMGAALIVLATMLTATNNVVWNVLSPTYIALQLIILGSAYVGGTTLSTAIAVLMGTIISLSHLSFSGMIAVYALTGLCAGVCKKLGRFGIVLGSSIATAFFVLYDATLPIDKTYFIALGVATLLFLTMPKTWLVYWQRQLYPNHEEVLLERQRWLTEKVTLKLTNFNDFVIFMKELVNDRFGVTEKQPTDDVEARPLSPCESCYLFERCWGADKKEMEPLMQQWLMAQAVGHTASKLQYDDKIRYKCVRSSLFLNALAEFVSKQQLSGQFQHGKKMIALQLKDMSTHIDSVMKDMTNDTVSFQQQEDQLANRFKEIGIDFFQIDILTNEPGNRKLVCCIPYKKTQWETDQMVAERLILPALQEVFKEPFEIHQTVKKTKPYAHLQITFQSAIRFTLQYDVLSISKNNTMYSGDSHAVFSLNPGLTAIMLSDGMGHNKRAHKESRKLIRLMRECLHHQMSPETAMHTLHYVMSLKQEEEMYATMDFALIDLQHGKLWSWKAGSMATYLVRGREVTRVESASEPFGLFTSFSVDAEQRSLKAGDIIFMCTDGLFFENMPWDQQEKLLRNSLLQHRSLPIQEICPQILNTFRNDDQPIDDCTIVCVEIQHKTVDWSLFKPTLQEISRERMVR
ncbi:MAG TPA: SpoIIE family protein phosphatase [Rummeliibacillus sp.]|nr:SpoIIE family protein phosphatase [Rummeliibacillus sp.]